MSGKSQWLQWAMELQDLSQCALAYCRDKYDIERFGRIRQISAEMLAALSDRPAEEIKAWFCAGTGYQTPKVDTRAAVFRNGKLLLVQENNGEWALPGGWVDYNLSVRRNAVKEVLEEAGMVVGPVRLIAVLDHNRHHPIKSFHEICSVYVLCEYISGEFRENLETVGCGFFGPDEIPAPLALGKTTSEQIDMCFRAAEDDHWQVIFD